MSKLNKDQVIAKFSEAYTAANGKSPEIESKAGWYSVDGGKNMRLAQLNELADQLNASHAQVVETAKPVPAAKATKTNKKAATAFSVKAFWADKIQSDNPDTRAPR